MWQVTVYALLAAGILLAQQHSYTPADIQAGERLYGTSCGACHGQAGNTIGGVELNRAEFLNARTDEHLVGVIQNGVPNTAMPPSAFSEEQATSIVAYLRFMSGTVDLAASDASPAGDPTRGRAIFEGKGDCLRCHTVNGAGGSAGPDLSRIGAPQGGGRGGPVNIVEHLERSILDPNANIAPAYRVYEVVTSSGTRIRGTLLNQDTFSVQMRDSEQNLRSFMKADLREFQFMPSPMPSYRDVLTSQELADLISFLLSLRGPN